MQVEPQVSYRHTETSEPLNSLILTKTRDLERFFDRITGCHVFIDRESHHHRKGKGAHFRVRVELSVPGEVLVVGRDPKLRQSHEDAFVAVNEAFHAIRRQLQGYVARHRGKNGKAHLRPPHGLITRLFYQDGYGFLETPDEREVYFNRASVLNGGFDRLEVGDEVRFAEEHGDEGPQASSVEPVGREGHHEFPLED
jgi:cold shock CspA family protein/ribosome-associated translation inhibitor RaiA